MSHQKNIPPLDPTASTIPTEPLDNSEEAERAKRAALRILTDCLRVIEYELYADESRGRIDSSLIEEKKKIIQEIKSGGMYGVGAIDKLCARYREECAKFHKTRDEELLGRESTASALEKGKFCEQVIDDMKKIKFLYEGGRSLAQIQEEYSDLSVWNVWDTLLPEDQEIFNHPRRWESTVGYATLVLSKIHNTSKHTITSWRKAYRRSLKK